MKYVGQAVAIGLSLLVAVSACSDNREPSNGDGGDGMIELSERPTITSAPDLLEDLTGMSLPIDAYRIRGEARATVTKAVWLLAGDCMKKKGFRDPYADRSPPVVVREGLERRYGVADLELAAEWGYHLPPGWDTGGEAPSSGERLALTEAELDALGGPVDSPDQGCLGQARFALAPDGYLNEADPELVRRINGSRQPETDPAVIDVISRWSECMMRKGYDLTGPLDDNKTVAPGPVPSAEEIREAVADVECKTETNLVGVWFNVDVTYQNAMIDRHNAELTEIKNRNDAVVRAAAEVIATGGA